MTSRIQNSFDKLELTDCFIAGGAVLSAATKNNINDYDVYPKSKQGFINVVTTLMESNCFIVNITNRAFTFKSNSLYDNSGNRAIIQVMIFDWFPTAQHIFEKFDFTVCMGAYDCDTHEFVFHNDFYPDIASKTLRFNHNTAYPLASLIRISKYQSKGYYISKFEQAKVAMAIAKIGMPTSWEELENQIGGVYGKSLKLANNDVEFSYDNAIEILSNTVMPHAEWYSVESYDDIDKIYSHIKLEDIVNYFSDDTTQFITVGKHYNYFIEDGYFVGERFSKHMCDILGTPTNFSLKKDGLIYGFKRLANGMSNMKQSNTTFSSRKKSLSSYSKEFTYLVSTELHNITSIYGSTVHANALRVYDQVSTDDSTRLDEVYNSISTLLTA